ncbi:MAG: Spy/CpxP family protein refolding chaperone [Candidatus Zhuqueibacterota bacterium]
MKKVWLIALILLLVINLSAFVTMTYNRLNYRKCQMAGAGETGGIYLCQELCLNSNQVEKVKTIRRAFSTQSDEITLPLQQRRAELVQLLAQTPTDSVRIFAVAATIDSLQGELHRQVIQYLLKEKEVFSPDQQQKFFSLIEARLNCPAGHHSSQQLNLMDSCAEQCDTTTKCPINKTE